MPSSLAEQLASAPDRLSKFASDVCRAGQTFEIRLIILADSCMEWANGVSPHLLADLVKWPRLKPPPSHGAHCVPPFRALTHMLPTHMGTLFRAVPGAVSVRTDSDHHLDHQLLALSERASS